MGEITQPFADERIWPAMGTVTSGNQTAPASLIEVAIAGHTSITKLPAPGGNFSDEPALDEVCVDNSCAARPLDSDFQLRLPPSRSMTARNPSNPFAQRLQRWSRPDEVRRQLHALSDGRPSFVLVGDEQSGKSELLNLVVRVVAQAGRRVLVASLDATVWTSETPEDQLTTDQFWRDALVPLTAVEEPTIQRLLRNANDRRFSSVTLEPLSRELHACGITLLVQVDNFDALLLTPIRDLRALLSTVRKIAGMARQGITLALASYRRIDELNRQTEALCAGSPYFNVFEELILEPLPEEGVSEILHLSDGRFSGRDCDFIRRAAGGHPELLWRAGALMWETHIGTTAPELRVLQVGRELVFGASSLLATTWGRWSADARYILLNGMLAGLGTGPSPNDGMSVNNFSEPASWRDDMWLCERLCEAMGDQANLLRLIARVDARLIFELPSASVPLRQLTGEAVALLRRRGCLDKALTLWNTEPWLAAHIRRPYSAGERGLLPATTEHLRRTGWIDVRGPRRSATIRVGLLSWWLIEGLAPVARGEQPMDRWLQQYQLDQLSTSLIRDLEVRIASSREHLVCGSPPWITGDFP